MKNNKLNSQPTKWPRVKLGEICDLVNGDAYRESDWNTEGVPIIRIQNLNNPNKPFNYWTGNIDDRVVVKPGDVLLAWSGTPGTSFGTHRWTRGIGILNQHIFRVDLDTTRIDPEWAVFSINEQLEEMIGRAHGAVGLRHVTRASANRFQFFFHHSPSNAACLRGCGSRWRKWSGRVPPFKPNWTQPKYFPPPYFETPLPALLLNIGHVRNLKM